MNPYRVTTQAEFEEHLKAKGFVKTDTRTATGYFWRSLQTQKHLLVPDPYEGMYPKFILKDFEETMAKMGHSQSQ